MKDSFVSSQILLIHVIDVSSLLWLATCCMMLEIDELLGIWKHYHTVLSSISGYFSADCIYR